VPAVETKDQAQELFSVSSTEVQPKFVAPVSEQSEWESRRLWEKVTKALRARDMDSATQAKTNLEDEQRRGAKMRLETGEAWQTKHFSPVPGTDQKMWRFNEMPTKAFPRDESSPGNQSPDDPTPATTTTTLSSPAASPTNPPSDSTEATAE